jgi:hypothetical protein
MAEVEVKIKVEGVDEATNSMQQLRKELKAAQSAALNGDGKAAKRVAELKDKIDDLKDATKTLQGSGVEKVTSSFNTLGEGFRNFDTDKIKLGFKGIGAAMSAIPIFLVVEGISYLVRNFDELSKGSGPLAVVLRSVGDAISYITDKIGAVINYFTDLTGATSQATRDLEKQGEAIKGNADKATEALNAQTEAYDRQIAIAKASGKSTVEAEKAKQQAIIDTNLAIARQIEAYVRAGGELDDEKKKQLNASLAAIRAAKTEEKIIEIEDVKAKQEAAQKKKEIRQKENEDLFNEALKQQEEEENRRSQALRNEEKAAEQLAAQRAKSLEELKALKLKADQDEIASNQAKWAEEERLRQKDIEDQKAARDVAFQIAQNGLTAVSNLSEIAFMAKKANLKKGSAEEEKAARQQFKINKALQLAGAIIDGGKAINASLAQSPLAIGPVPNPAGIASLAAAATTTALNIAKIAKTQFETTSGGGDIGGGATASAAVPNVNTNISPNINANSNVQQSTFLGDDKPPIRVVAEVVETQSTKAQKRVSKLESQATF